MTSNIMYAIDTIHNTKLAIKYNSELNNLLKKQTKALLLHQKFFNSIFYACVNTLCQT